MNNQAAQTMPELPEPFDTMVWGEFSQHQTPVYSAGQVYQYARDYAAMLAAAPAASGVHPDALPDGTLSKSTAKRVTALAAASVSERARAILKSEMGGFGTDTQGRIPLEYALRAIEQALTQQRGECWPLNKNPKDGWTFDPSFLDEVKTRAEQSDIGEFAPCLEGVESVLIALRNMGSTTPQHSADAVREYVTELRAQADKKMVVAGACVHDGDRAHYKSAAQLLRRVADKLESLLSAASGEGVG